MVDHKLVPEPPDASLILVGDPRDGVVLLRDDHTAREGGYLPAVRWFDLGDRIDPLSWAQVIGVEPDGGRLGGADRPRITRLHTEDELREAVAKVQLRVVGDHIVEAGGWCRTHGSQHSPEEIARAEDRLAGEEGDGRG